MAKAVSDSIKVLESHDAEAESYIDSILSTQRAVKVDSPVTNGKKRHLSNGGSADSPLKKVRNVMASEEGGDLDQDSSESASGGDLDDESGNNCNRKLRKKKSKAAAASRNIFRVNADVHSDPDPNDVSVKQLLAALSADMHKMYTSLHDRIDKFEAGLEQRISSKVAQLLDKRVNTELGRIRKDVDERLGGWETLRKRSEKRSMMS